MKHTSMHFDGGFEVGFTLRDVQAAQMVLAPGTHTGGPHNRHVGADQWLYVVGGAGEAVVDGARQPLQAGSLLVIERGEAHEIRCTGDASLRTLNLYSPPAYGADGEPLNAGKR
jgi:mannose-6-phosphate isomerase-like protein (cupin superfamily)